MLQFTFARGFAEFDDLFQNVLGCAIGFGVYVGGRLVGDADSVEARDGQKSFSLTPNTVSYETDW